MLKSKIQERINRIQKAKIQNNHEDKEWEQFSLTQASLGLEKDEFPEYTEQDLKEKWQ